MPARRFDFLATLSLFLLCTATVWAEEALLYDPEKVAALATDEPVTTPDAKVVAQEILRLQEDMGGSIVSRWEPRAFPPPAEAGSPRQAFNSPVIALRETAWQLEQSAYVLESLDLYEQADAVRDTADRLRRDAREMKGAESSKAAK